METSKTSISLRKIIQRNDNAQRLLKPTVNLWLRFDIAKPYLFYYLFLVYDSVGGTTSTSIVTALTPKISFAKGSMVSYSF